MSTFADDRVRQAIMGVRAISRAHFPGTEDVTIGVRALSEMEIDDCRIEAQCHFDLLCKRARQDLARFLTLDTEALDREHQRQCIARAVVQPDSGEPFFQDASQVRKLSPVQVQRLWDLYMDHQNAIAPRTALEPDEVERLVEALKKKPESAALLEAFERDTLCNLVRTLAHQLAN